MSGLDPIPGHHPRLLIWANWFRNAGFTAREVAQLFEVDLGQLIESGIQP